MKVDIGYSFNLGQCLLKTDNSALLSEVRENFSVPNPHAAYQSKWAPNKLYAMTPAGKFNPGLLVDVIKTIKELSPDCVISLDQPVKDILSCGYDGELEYLDCDLELRYYQKEIIEKSLQRGNGVCVLGTGGGKTLTIATLIHNIIQKSNLDDFKCLLIVPDVGLVQQTFQDFEEYNVPFTFSRWSGDHKLNTESNVVIATSKIFQRQFDQHDWFQHVDLVVVDEVHKVKHKNKLGKLIKKIHTPNKFGFTGTLPEEKIDQWSVIGAFGPCFYEKGSDELREEGFLTSAEVKVLKIAHKRRPKTQFKPEEWTSTAMYVAELDFIYESEYRNKVIKKICTNFENNTLILVNHIRHGEILQEVLSDITGRQIYFVQGEVEVEERERIKKIMENNCNVICIAMTSVFSTGINVKNIHMILFASGGKAFIRLVQSIGRGLRKHHTKDKLIIIDLADQFKYGLEHLAKRLTIYEKEKIPFSISSIKELN